MAYILTDMAEVSGLMVAQKLHNQAQPHLGTMNETTKKDSSVFSWFLHWFGIMEFNPYGLINSQLIVVGAKLILHP